MLYWIVECNLVAATWVLDRRIVVHLYWLLYYADSDAFILVIILY
uniref:Uncharacterized protein n=1 Tax=Arundo donax TaxID=35708 RepID=A0A0A8ZIL2_ARUDO